MADTNQENFQDYREMLTGDYCVCHKCTRTNEKTRLHIHNEFEVLLLLSPGVKLDTGSRSYSLPQYSLLLFNNMDLHLLSLVKPGTENNRYVVYFKPEYINNLSTEQTDLLECFMLRPIPDANLLALDEATAIHLASALDQIILLQENAEDSEYGTDLQIKMMLGNYLLRINRIYRKYHHLGNPKAYSSYRTIYAIINYLHQNYSDDISLDQLAHQFFMNKYYMCTLFREITGMSPRQYLINCRLMKAKELLINNMAVEEVCGKVGYNNLSHFSRAFKSKIGTSPKQYQMNAQAKTRNHL